MHVSDNVMSDTPVTSMAKGKWAESKEESLNKLLDTLDKAAGRTMDDQRVNLRYG